MEFYPVWVIIDGSKVGEVSPIPKKTQPDGAISRPSRHPDPRRPFSRQNLPLSGASQASVGYIWQIALFCVLSLPNQCTICLVTDRSPLLLPTVISSLFWMAYWLLFAWLLSNFMPYQAAVAIAAVTVAAQAGVAFLNVRYLIPTYLEKGHYGRYGLLVLVILIVVPLLAISVNRYAIATPNLLAGNSPRLYQFARWPSCFCWSFCSVQPMR
ncbi:hypothetical protein [Spirosoma radiotolerans]|uniref:Uncharacterized protein n=1 Tax=Spirosoma radiotolerans TaxID=1379870 RepID=A0A0E3ZV57_9BACT|nr:hypothetical protein [Spirosoma radiotolerans]AKD54849.1 hypothetical protein SD10_07945 [Spirosoma radiotolerans]